MNLTLDNLKKIKNDIFNLNINDEKKEIIKKDINEGISKILFEFENKDVPIDE